MVADLQMARGAVDGGYNLAVGEPVVVQQRLLFSDYKIQGPFQYPTLHGEPSLMKELQAMYPGEEVVISVGAKQALSAAFYAFKCVRDRVGVYHTPPYWPSYRTLTMMQGLRFISEPGLDMGRYIHCVTSPNNPDGRVVSGACDIWDAAYASPLYGWNGCEPQALVRVYSAAKLLGLSGARVGWLVTKDQELARWARLYVEFSTSGVSVPAQLVVAQALDRHRRDWLSGHQLSLARGDILANGRVFNQVMGPYCQVVTGVPRHQQGMFAYFKVNDELIEPGDRDFENACRLAKVAVVTGLACGETYSGWYRMNMAQTTPYTEAALLAIKEQLR